MLIFTASIALVAGCGTGESPAGRDAAFQARARAVADAWQAALAGAAGQAWRAGFVPLQDLTVPPGDAMDDDTRFAFESGWFTTRIQLPDATPQPGIIEFPGGAMPSVPLISARTAYAALHRGEPPCRQNPGQAPAVPPGGSPGSPVSSGPVGAPAKHTCAVLTVTAARLGSTTMRTSRGVAVVPAWLFTVAELSHPVARAAVAPESLSPMPRPSIASMDAASARGLAGAQRLTEAQDRRLSYIIGIGGCDRSPAGMVYETLTTVVIAGRADPPDSGPCSGSLTLQPVSVTLARPLGSRAVIDAITARPLVADR